MDMTETLQFMPYRAFALSDLLKMSPCAEKAFALPGNPETDKYILPVSGGGDSAVLAIVMHLLFPHIPFVMVFTDTLADEVEIYETLSSLEKYLGKEITRIVPEKGLYELIEQYKGYLPSSQARWCTRVLKLEAFRPWLEQYAGIQKHMFVGIRADEPSRLAFTIDEVETHMPFIDLGLVREHIFSILERTIGIPKFYRRRTRSGCSNCPFQRRSELVGLLQEQPCEFNKGCQYEKLDPADMLRHPEAMPLWKDSGIAANWQNLPLPMDGAKVSGKRPKTSTDSLFGNMRGIYLAAEFFMDGMYRHDEFFWHQRLISYSPTLAGLTRQINDRYRHLLSTGEVYGMSPDDVRAQARFAVYYIELPEEVFDPEAPKGKGYTWQQGSSYAQLRHIVQWGTRVLHAESMRQMAAKTAKSDLSVQYEWIQEARAGIARLQEEVGQVVASQWYQPTEKEPVLTEEEELATLPCPMCHI